MPEIRPFAAVRYAQDADLPAVTCPPYDVLSPEERRALIDRSPHATARLILPEGEGDAKYANAARLWEEWRQGGILQQDATPGFYVTRTEFTEPGAHDGLRQHRLGLVCLLRLHEYADGMVRPHEHTLSRPKEDRLSLLRATHANFESIMALVEDADRAFHAALEAATALPPLADFTEDDGQRHTLYKIENPQNVASVADFLRARPVYIADGHHRYETSVAYAQETGALGADRPEAFLLTTISSFADPGLALLPTHRLVRGTSEAALASLFRHLGEHFDVHEIDLGDLEGRLRLRVANQCAFGLVMPTGTVYLVAARDASRLDADLPTDLEPSLRRLDVTILQHLVLDRVLGIPAAETATTERLAYTRDDAEAVRRVHAGEFDLALLLGRTPVEAVRDVSDAGAVMPQKSTFFYPKLLSGLVLRAMD